jgi:nucleotide-binding universal stress UspA family protein
MLNMKRLLCPVDLSEASQHALEQAIVVAGWFESRLTVQHVYSQVFLPIPSLAMPGYSADLVVGEDDRRRLVDDVTAFATPAREAGADTDVVVEMGQPVPRILALATALPADLIVMGTHGASGFEHFVLGSVTEKVLRKAACPVLTVPPRAQAQSALPFKRILCAVDFSESSLAALTMALAFAQEADAHLAILHVLEWPVEEPVAASTEVPGGGPIFDLQSYRSALEVDAKARLATLVPDEARNWCSPETTVAHGKPYAEILKAAIEDRADLIVLGVRGRRALDLALFGSTANQVVRQATCPVLTVRR